MSFSLIFFFQARIFHAQPLPDQKEQVGIPVKKSKPTTKPAPFNLEGENNGAKRAEKWAEEVSTGNIIRLWFKQLFLSLILTLQFFYGIRIHKIP